MRAVIYFEWFRAVVSCQVLEGDVEHDNGAN